MSDRARQFLDGELFRAYIARCVECANEQAIYPTQVDGHSRLYRGGAEWQLRNLHYWTTHDGKWLCPDCRPQEVGVP